MKKITYDLLLDEAEGNLIEVIELPLQKTLKGIYADSTIAINKHIETTAEKKCILAEELGHYHTSTGNILDQESSENRKQERRARIWSFQEIFSLKDILTLLVNFKGELTVYTISEELDLTEEFITDALSYYKEKYGLYTEYDGYYIFFSPLTAIKK